MELRGLGFRGAGHARKFFVEPEVVLQSDRGQRLVLFFDLDAFFGFDCLVQAVGPTAALHQTPGKVVNDDHFAILDHVLVIEPVKRVGLQSLLDAMQQLHV